MDSVKGRKKDLPKGKKKMKKTYYYNGIKVRTSENEYKYAVLRVYENGIGIVACCGRYDLAVKRFNQEGADFGKAIRNYKRHIEEIENGTFKDFGFDKNGKWCQCIELNEEQLSKQLQGYKEQVARLERMLNAMQIVELEQR